MKMTKSHLKGLEVLEKELGSKVKFLKVYKTIIIAYNADEQVLAKWEVGSEAIADRREETHTITMQITVKRKGTTEDTVRSLIESELKHYFSISDIKRLC